VIEPPPLPAFGPSAITRWVLATASVLAILSGQFVAHGTLYILTFMGISGGITFLLKDALEASGGAVHAAAFVAPLAAIAMMLLLYAGLLGGLCVSVYLAFTHRHSSAARAATALFAALAVCTVLGLTSMRWLEARPEFHGNPSFAPFFFLWPVAFITLAFTYARLFPKPRNVTFDP
jgi:hypothetical protein